MTSPVRPMCASTAIRATSLQGESGVTIELRDNSRVLILPRGIPATTTTNMAIEHSHLLWQPVSRKKNRDGLINTRKSVDLARYYTMLLHLSVIFPDIPSVSIGSPSRKRPREYITGWPNTVGDGTHELKVR